MNFFVYLGQICLYAFITWGIYCLVWRNKNWHRGARFYLLSGLLLPLVIPFIHLPVPQGSVIAHYQIDLPEITVAAIGNAQEQANDHYTLIAVWTYALCAAAIALIYASAYWRVAGMLRNGNRIRYAGYSVSTNTGIGPGTFWRHIFFPNSEVNHSILQHELAHIRAGHRFDTLLLQVMHVLFWISPAHWLIGRELKTVHEFEADQAAATNADAYAMVLLQQSLGSYPSSTIAHSFFHHPLKRRIQMLHDSQLPKRKFITLLTAAGALVVLFSTVLFGQSKKTHSTKRTVPNNQRTADSHYKVNKVDQNHNSDSMNYKLHHGGVVGKPISNGKGAEYKMDAYKKNGEGPKYRYVEQMPEFNGNISEWMAAHLHYPDSARAHGNEGRVGVEFVVDEKGKVSDVKIVRSSGNPLLDEEALRVVNSMPPWKPGKQQGKPVPVIFTLPITFKLTD